MVFATVGWPGIGAGVRWGVVDGFDVGVEALGLVGSPVMGFDMGVGGAASLPLRLRVVRWGRWNAAVGLTPRGMAGERGLFGGVSSEEPAPAWGVGVGTSVAVGYDITWAVTFAASMQVDAFLIGSPVGATNPWAGTWTGGLSAEGRMSEHTLLFVRTEAGYGFADGARFGSRGIFRWIFGAAFSL